MAASTCSTRSARVIVAGSVEFGACVALSLHAAKAMHAINTKARGLFMSTPNTCVKHIPSRTLNYKNPQFEVVPATRIMAMLMSDMVPIPLSDI